MVVVVVEVRVVMESRGEFSDFFARSFLELSSERIRFEFGT